ncbi:hypothetical protein [Paenibacillus sp. P46E]|uniref:hypothetical protein n=1 Tax=Paenibacillus sp. P46E TaxID=1349436 RepID=UPI00093FCF09|nr:hypothetical protein [Paenibacillus sp. P46E]OKP97771.1 hypothetical protein A3849_13785 [Paenibacillus sp. P46E]
MGTTTLILPGTAAATDVKTGKKFSSGTLYNADGTMIDNGAMNFTPSRTNQRIPEGYHNGSGNVAGVYINPADLKASVTYYGWTGTYQPTPVGDLQTIGLTAPASVSTTSISFLINYTIPSGKTLLSYTIEPSESATYFLKSSLTGTNQLCLAASYTAGSGSMGTKIGPSANNVVSGADLSSFNSATGVISFYYYLSTSGSVTVSLNNASGVSFQIRYSYF